jgi:hypothetical protein
LLLFPPFRRFIGYFATFAPQEKLCINLKKLICIFGGESDRFWLVGKKSGKVKCCFADVVVSGWWYNHGNGIKTRWLTVVMEQK